MGIFLVIWLGQVVSILGTGMTSFALGVEVFRETGSVTRFAFISLVTLVPILLLSPIAGVVVDRRDRRLVLIVSNLGSALCSLLLYWLISTGRLETWHVYATIALSSAFTAFILPALMAATTLLVGKQQFGRAGGMSQMAGSLSRILAPLLAGALLAAIGLKGIVLVDFSTFLFAALVLLVVRIPRPETSSEGRAARGTVQRQVGYAWKFLRERPGLFRLLLLFAGVNFSVGMVPVLITPLVLGFASPAALGVVLAVASSGMLVGALGMSVWGGAPPGRRVAVILFSLLAQGVFLLLGGLHPSATLITLAAFLFMVLIPINLSTSQAIWQSKVPPDLQGRVFAIRSMIVGSAMPVALLIAGPLMDHVFEPLLAAGGPLADSVGRLIGVGPGRGAALFLIVLGVLCLVSVAGGFRSLPLRRLEEEVADAVGEAAGSPEGGAAAPGRLVRTGGVRLGPLPAVTLLAVLVAGAAGAILSQRGLPDVVPASAPPAEFSAERTMADLRIIAKQPRPIGSPAHREVRAHLAARLRSLGLETQVQRADSVLSRPPLAQVVTVENVIGRLRGTQPGGAVLLLAHYDSVPTSFGAADDGSGVATLLETARALASGPRPRNDVLFLFTDSEESGLHGARAFVQGHPWAHDVEVVLNFEARGHGGPVYMFQTGATNGGWISHFLGAAPRPVASSLLNEIYRHLPNETDFTVFRDAGYDGFNFAFIEGLTHYHSWLDRAEEVDLRSVQHQGSYALGLARAFGSQDLAAVTADAPDRTYFNLGPWMVQYPRGVALASAAVAVLLFLSSLVLGLRRRVLSVFGIFLGALAFFCLMIAVPVTVTLLWSVVRDAASVPLVTNSTEGAGFFMAAFACLALAVAALLVRFFLRVIGGLDLAMGALLWWTLLVVLASGLWLPAEANFPFVWPLLAASLGIAWLCAVPAEARRPWRTVLVLALAALPGLLLLAPLAGLTYVSLQGLAQLGGAALILEVLLLGLLIPHLEGLLSRRPSWLPAAAAAAGLILLGVALWGPGRHVPWRQDSVFYALDTDAGTASWYSYDTEPDAWTRQFGFAAGTQKDFTAFLPVLHQKLLHSTAPVVDLPRPEVEVVEQSDLGEDRQIRLRLRTPPGSRGRLIWFDPPGGVVTARIGGAMVPLQGGDPAAARMLMRLPAPEGDEEVVLRVRGKAPLRINVVEQLEGLPAVPGLRPRDEFTIPRPFLTLVRSDVTLVKRSFGPW